MDLVKERRCFLDVRRFGMKVLRMLDFFTFVDFIEVETCD